MSKIQNLQEPWNGHTYSEVEEFVKGGLTLHKKEHVTVQVRGCEYDEDDVEDKPASVEGGKVYVEAFNPATCENLPVQEFDIPASGIVEFDIPFGIHYAVYSKKSGLGASFRPVFTASLENRTVYLWNLTLGTLLFGYSVVYDEDDNYRLFPIISTDGAADPFDFNEWDKQEGEETDEAMWNGIVVSGADVTVLLLASAKSEETLAWSKMNQGRNVPGLEEYYETHNHDHEEAVAAAKLDFSGSLNTEKIMLACAEAPAAYFAAATAEYYAQRYLPSVGELDAIYQNKAAINAINEDASLIADIDTDYYWSSCPYDRYYAFTENMDDGNVDSNRKINDNGNYALGVSAFLYLY